MIIAILSDIHDNLVNLKKCLDWCEARKIKQLLFCGDATTVETIKNLAGFSGEVFIVRGNMELYEERDLPRLKNLTNFGRAGSLEIDRVRIALTHEPYKIAGLLKSQSDLNYVFYGHTHKPWLEKRDEVFVVNPGNLAGVWYPATFATLDTATGKLELKIMSEL